MGNARQMSASQARMARVSNAQCGAWRPSSRRTLSVSSAKRCTGLRPLQSCTCEISTKRAPSKTSSAAPAFQSVKACSMQTITPRSGFRTSFARQPLRLPLKPHLRFRLEALSPCNECEQPDFQLQLSVRVTRTKRTCTNLNVTVTLLLRCILVCCLRIAKSAQRALERTCSPH